jgi:hypothetical protein
VTLGLDPNGLGITVQGQSTHESTVLQASIASIPTVTENQPTTIPLHLKSNSTTVNMNITISLNIQSSGIVTTQSGIFLAPGTSKDVTFTFTAPSTPGAYTLTFLSADYGAPLITGTLQVSVLQSSLQVIVPAIIGVVAAIVIMLFFLFRRKPETTSEPVPKDKPTGGKPKTSPETSTTKSLTDLVDTFRFLGPALWNQAPKNP